MVTTKEDDIKEVLLNCDIEIISDITHDIICTVCRKIMIEPCSMSCGCNFCKSCFEDYLRNGTKHCAAHSSVVSSKDIHLNSAVKRKIETLMVKCPNVLCHTQTELCRMMEHIRLCPLLRQESCESRSPLNSIQGLVKDSHSGTVTLYLNSLRNEMDAMKRKHEEQLKMQQRQIDRLGEEVKDIKRDSEMEQQRYERKFEEQKMEIETLQRDSRKMRTEMDSMKGEMGEMKKMVEIIKNESDGRYEKQNLELGDIRMERMDRDKWNKVMRKKVNTLEIMTANLGGKIGKLDCGEYIWTINGFSEKRKEGQNGTRKVIKSDPFYSHRNGYKMCVRIYPNGFGPGLGTHLYLGFVIMKGEYDDVLKWPFKHRVTLSLVNQRTGEDHTRMEYEYNTTKEELRYILDKATNEKNVGLGYSKFILLETLINNADTFTDDKVCIRCTVSLQPH